MQLPGSSIDVAFSLELFTAYSGKIGGSKTSDAKKRSSKLNGLKGGRPKRKDRKGYRSVEQLSAKMAFYIYENWQAGPHKAVIHDGSCGHCNQGRGRAGGYDPSHAKWHGPYETLEKAHAASAALSGVVVRKEDRCVS